jgi:UDP-glucose 4-epimerase
VLIVDSLIPDYGGNLFNIDGIETLVRVNIADVRQQSTMNYLVQGQDVIFNLAGQVSHIDSMQDPYTDLEINCRSQLFILEACRRNNPAVKVVFAGTRQIYGGPIPPGDRDASRASRPTSTASTRRPASITTWSTTTCSASAPARCADERLRPATAVKHNRQGFIGWFIRLAIEDARSRSTATASSCATSCTWTMPPMRSCGPAQAIAATERCSTSAAPRPSLFANSSSS